ncbi:MAG: hypothetical protein ACKVS5_08670 [Parvularculaceae bacterium]
MSNLDLEHRKNSRAISELPKGEFETHRGEFAVLVAGSVSSYHKTNREAILAARSNYVLGQFSVQRIEPQPVDVGFIDRADYPR